MLQTTAVSDGVITTGLALPSAVEQPLRTVQTPAAVRKPAVKPVAQEIEPSNANPDIKESVKATSVSLKSLELASLTPASAPEQADPAIESDTRPNTATTLASIAGAGFIKIADSGEALDDKAEKWECVEDESNNLTWEVKKNDGGIRDKDYLYSWLINVNGENKGVADGGRCKGGVKCDTYSYVRAMNELKLCGYSDWRVPTRKELETLVDLNATATDATISKMYFPEAVPSWYWTSTENPQRENFAWYILFRNGIALNDLKERPKHIRLVRGNIEQ